MGWETRQGQGRYYTTSRRVHGRVVREYVGTGPVAELMTQLDARERARRAEERAAFVAEQAQLAALAEPVLALDAFGEALARATLLGVGYHRHHRGTWRKHRHGEAEAEPTTGADGE